MSLMLRLTGRQSRAAGRRPRSLRPACLPLVEGLESRTVLNAPGAVAPIAVPAAVIPTTAPAVSILPLRITDVAVQNGQLVAQGTLGGQAFSTPITLTTSPSADPTCPILNLQLAPIHLSLLGLNVDTSAICLKITAQSGAGNLLGNLLCDVANLLNNGTPLGTILGGLSTTDLTTLTTGVTDLLNGVLADLTTTSAAPTATQATPSVHGATCDILHLSLGPVDLNLLGLDVHLDNCANGPVTVDITATQGGGLLGDLLCDLSNLLNSHAASRAITVTLQQIAGEIGSLL